MRRDEAVSSSVGYEWTRFGSEIAVLRREPIMQDGDVAPMHPQFCLVPSRSPGDIDILLEGRGKTIVYRLHKK